MILNILINLLKQMLIDIIYCFFHYISIQKDAYKKEDNFNQEIVNQSSIIIII